MPMQPVNPLSELSELFIADLEVNKKGGRNARVELRLGEAEVRDGAIVFTVAAQRVFLGLDLTGLSVAFGSRFGDVEKENLIKSTRKTELVETHCLKGNAEISANLAKGNLKGRVGGGASYANTVREKETNTETLERTLVTPRGGDKWEIFDAGGKLDGKYLSAKNVLCLLKPVKGSNQQHMTVRTYVKQRDLLWTMEAGAPYFKRLTVTQEKIIGILLTKALNTKAPGQPPYSGALILSEAESDYEE